MFIKPNQSRVWLRRSLVGLSIAAGILLVAGGYVYLQLFADVPIADSPAIKMAETIETKRKLNLFENARRIGRKGYIHLAQGELNAFLDDYVATLSRPDSTNGPAGQSQLLKARVFLMGNGFVWVCWVRQAWRSWNRDLIWQRTFELVRTNGQWDLHPTDMQVGYLEIPKRFWGQVEGVLGSVDKPFDVSRRWVSELPALEIRTNDFLTLEVKLYNYPDPNVLDEARR
ncbi:MAG TPA: hypothetical protein P5186_24070 [Candidatus Paceibacterota bacterium]|nr:hypothetical protein [Verrucomicrobiota bacterium]HRY51138.1 hypothetical protein [Candidatus Paceibacterota bacterium]HSA01008.1 hypothetical protein [Candidatus Paceibacterota bacterium]